MQEGLADTTDLKKKLLKATCAGCSKSLSASSIMDKCPNCGGLLFTESQAIPAGTRIGDTYEITGQLGVGAWGAVYKARHLSLGRDVAIKVLHEHLTGKTKKLERFAQEVRSLNVLNHEAVAAVFDTGELESKQPYLVQEYVEGTSLREFIDRGDKLSAYDFKEVFARILEALEQAHAKGIVHRDIKPSNIMVSMGESSIAVKLLDFGIAKLVDQEGAPSLTATGDLLGTPLYMSPEQCVGATIDSRSDIYALGCVLHEVFSGAPPFEAENSFQCMMKQMHEPAPDLRLFGVNDEFNTFIMKALEKFADDRYADASEFRRCLLDLPDSWQGGPGAIRMPRKSEHRVAIGAFAAGVAVTVATSGVIWFLTQKHESSQPTTSAVPRKSQLTALEKGSQPADLIEISKELSNKDIIARSKLALPTSPDSAHLQFFAQGATYSANGERVASPVNLSGKSYADVVFNEQSKECFALTDAFKLCRVDEVSGESTPVALPSDMPQQVSGIAFDGSGKNLYVLSSQLLRYDIAQKTWQKLGEFPAGGAGFACAPDSSCFYEFGRSNAPIGELHNLYKLDDSGKILQKIALSQPILTADGPESMLQLRSAGKYLIAAIPQPLVTGHPRVFAVINPANGEVVNVTAVSK